MKNNHDPAAMIGGHRMKQIRKRADAPRRAARGLGDNSAHTVLLLEEARKWLEQFYSETEGMNSRSSEAFKTRWAHVRRQIRDGQLDYLTREELEYGAKVAW